MPVPIPCCFHLCFLKVVCPSVGPDTLPGVLQMEPPSSFMSALDTIFFQLNTCLALVGTSLGEKKEIGMGRKENVGGFGEEAKGESGVPGRDEDRELTTHQQLEMSDGTSGPETLGEPQRARTLLLQVPFTCRHVPVIGIIL